MLSLTLLGCGAEASGDAAPGAGESVSDAAATGPAAAEQGSTSASENERKSSSEPTTEGKARAESVPDGFPDEVPLLEYPITDVTARDEAREYRLIMHGTNVEDDAARARAQMAEAGFTELIWNSRDTQVSSVFTLDALQVGIKVRDTGDAITIQYDVGTH